MIITHKILRLIEKLSIPDRGVSRQAPDWYVHFEDNDKKEKQPEEPEKVECPKGFHLVNGYCIPSDPERSAGARKAAKTRKARRNQSG